VVIGHHPASNFLPRLRRHPYNLSRFPPGRPMAFDLDKAISTCLTCRGRFASIGEAREAFREIGGLTFEEGEAFAERLGLKPTVVRGLSIVSRHACMALDWLEYHGQPLTQWHLRQLHREFEQSDPKRDVLGWELQIGAWEVLRKVDWEPTAS
jgi:hypothetical protein